MLRIRHNVGNDINWVWNTLKITKTGVLGLNDEPEIKPRLQIYPNPVKDVLNIKAEFKISSLKIYNSRENIVFAKDGITGNDIESIEVSSLASGLYIECLYSAENSKPQVLKFVK